MRGNHIDIGKNGLQRRPIPAYAGEPPCVVATPKRVRAYPRVCGGTVFVAVMRLLFWGLSPRMRGNLRKSIFMCSGCGPIPAYAGEPMQPTQVLPFQGAYPRVCGGTVIEHAKWWRVVGLSPRMRGNRLWPQGQDTGAGPIPAYAGEPFIRHRQLRISGAYPRVCGGTLPIC